MPAQKEWVGSKSWFAWATEGVGFGEGGFAPLPSLENFEKRNPFYLVLVCNINVKIMQWNKLMKYLLPLIWGGLAMQLLVIDSYTRNATGSGFKTDNDRYNKSRIEVERYNSIV